MAKEEGRKEGASLCISYSGEVPCDNFLDSYTVLYFGK